MLFAIRRPGAVSWLALLVVAAPLTAQAAAPKVEDALKLAPIQSDVEYDRPTAAEVSKCTIKPEKISGQTGWVVRNENGQILRRFADTNGDNVVDQWCYYQDGIEVYRDVDQNFNGKADRYMWLNTGGSRVGTDANEDGRIDQWAAISPEEVSSEAVAAIAQKDAARFARLLISADEIKSLGLGADKASQLAKRVGEASGQFAALLKQQSAVTPKSVWMHFGATRPGLVPVGTDESTKDLLVYENVVAMIDTEGKHGQVHVGTLVRVGNAWRLVGAPQIPGEGDNQLADAGFFFQSPLANRPETTEQTGGPSQQVQDLLAELESLDKAGHGGSPADLAKHNAKRGDILERLANESTTPEDRAQWLRQLADTVSAAAQSGEYPDGVQRLKTLHEKLEKEGADADLAAYIKFRYLTADYGLSIQSPSADFAKIQTAWLESLAKYVADYPKSPDTAEAMLQLAVAREFAGQEDEAKEWYTKIVTNFPDAQAAKKAAGAKHRLDSVGKPIELQGKDVTGRAVDLAQYRKKLVLVHYWATWCEPCKAELATLKELQAKYGNQGFDLIGVSLDTNPEELASFLKQNRLPWAQIVEPGGLDGRLANELGVLTLPTMILVDEQGKVVDRNIHVTQLESELKKRLR